MTNTFTKRKQLIFIHIPKTAGESIGRALSKKSIKIKINSEKSNYKLYKLNSKTFSFGSVKARFIQHINNPLATGKKAFYKLISTFDKPTIEWLYLQKHSTALEIKKLLSKDDWNNCFKFALVRNPYDQVVSFYHHLRKPLYVNKKKLGRQYPEFLISGFLEPREACKAAMHYDFNEWVMKAYGYEEFNHYGWFDSQLKWLTNEREEVIVDFVGKYEELVTSWEIICDSLGIYVNLPTTNCSNRAVYRSYYTKSSKRIIESKFKNDLILYKYKF